MNYLDDQNTYILNLLKQNCLLGNAKIRKNADPDKYSYLGYGTGFDSSSHFQILIRVKISLFLQLI